MQVTRHFPAYDPAIWNRPWFALVGTWPDAGHAQLTFSKAATGDATGCAVALDAEHGDVVRWGQKALQPGPTGAHATQGMGWGIVTPTGAINEVTQDEARKFRRLRHPEDATAAPVAFGKSKGTKGKARKLTAAQVAAIAAKGTGAPAPAAGAATPSLADILASVPVETIARLLIERMGGAYQDDDTAASVLTTARAGIDGTLPVGATFTPAPAPKAAPAPMAAPDPASTVPQVDASGFPLF